MPARAQTSASVTIRHIPRNAWRFVQVVAVLNALVVAFLVISPWFRVDAAASPSVLLLLMAAMVVAELRPPGYRGPASDLARAVTWILAGSLVLLGAPHLAVVTLTATTLAGELFRRQPLAQGLFNASQLSLSIAAGATIIRALGQQAALTPGGQIDVIWVPTAAVAGLSVIMVNGVLTGTMRSITDNLDRRSAIRDSIDDTLRNEGVLFTLAPVMAVLAVRSPLLLPMPLVTALAVYRKANEASDQKKAASHDPLTGLPNRGEFELRTTAALEEHAYGAIALIDLDGFKAVNDQLGHQAGDEVLQIVSDRIQRQCRPEDVPARLGGDEFAVFLQGMADEVEAVAGRIVASIREPAEAAGAPVTIGASLGLALTPAHGTEFQTLVERADATMYLAKRQQLGVATYDPGTTIDTEGRATLQRSLREALENGEFDAHFQPWVDARSGTVLGIECLARWPKDDQVVLTPDQFLPLIRDAELAHQLTITMLDLAMRRARDWRLVGFAHPVSVNVPVVTARSPALAEDLEALLYRLPVDPRMIQLEVSDRGLLTDDSDLRENLGRVRELGVGLIVDDFGTGADSLVNLAGIGARGVKLSTRLTRGLFTRPGALTVVHHLMSMGRDLGVDVVAKHVEDADVARAITQAGGGLQGHLVAPARPGDEVTAWLHDRKARRAAELRDPTTIPPSSW